MGFGAEAEARGAQHDLSTDATTAPCCSAGGGASSETHPRAQSKGEERNTTLGYETKILKRAVIHLADRCRRIEANAATSAGEVAMLRQALEHSNGSQRRLTHANEMLQGHLRLQMDETPRF